MPGTDNLLLLLFRPLLPPPAQEPCLFLQGWSELLSFYWRDILKARVTLSLGEIMSRLFTFQPSLWDTPDSLSLCLNPGPRYQEDGHTTMTKPLYTTRVSSPSGCLSIRGCWGLRTLSGREARVWSVASHVAEGSGG